MNMVEMVAPVAVVAVAAAALLPRLLRHSARSAGRLAAKAQGGGAVGPATAVSSADGGVRVTVRTSSGGDLRTGLAAAGLGGDVGARIEAAVAQALAAAPAATVSAPQTADGELAVGEVISVSSLATGSPQLTLELDAIGAPKRRVTAAPLAGQILERGDRVYVRVSPDDSSAATLLPPSMTGGQSLPRGGNRLDVLVLGPQILRAGAKAKGVVKSAESAPMANPSLAARGFSKWRLELDVRPERGWPYNGELTISLSTPEKAARIAHAGAEVPLRYDPDDPKTLAIDSQAMGYGDPYEAVLKSLV